MATNQVLQKFGTTVTWTDTGGDKLMDLGGLAAAGLVMGAYLDLGASPRPTLYHFELTVDGFDTAPVVGETVNLRFAQSNATTNFDGNPTTDPTATVAGTITADQAKNIPIAGVARVYSTTAADELKISGIVLLTGRYVSPVVENSTADAFLSTADAHTLILTPISDDIQAAV